MNLLYEDLAEWWHLFSPPEEYVEEAAFFAKTFQDHSSGPLTTVLELGSGGGNNASHLKRHFVMTLVDLSPQMILQSGRLNPELEHHVGDMRTVRLDRTFDAVFVHDAIAYMTTKADLQQAIETAYLHCRPGGVALFAPDHVRETFAPSTDCGGSDDGLRGIRFLEWTSDPDPSDDCYTVDYVCALKADDGHIDMVHDQHIEGVFARTTWLDLLTTAGFKANVLFYRHTQVERELEVFVCRVPSAPTAG